ncbi:MAG TPA: response regulator [Flavisolibacter sp.]|nr:response regulator [Flavisolibacter sp.]
MTKILIIDDDPDIRTVISILLKKHNYEVQTAGTKAEAFQKIEQFPPSVILLDVLLSGSDGREICREIKASPQTQHIPVVMFSAHPGAADKIDTYGADDFIAKPFNLDMLLDKLAKQVKV